MACSFAVVPSQHAQGEPIAPQHEDCESKAAAPMIDTLLAVGFAAATFAALSADDDDADDSTVSTLSVGTATTAAFIASAAHGQNAIQSCRESRQKTPQAKAAVATNQATDFASQTTYKATLSANP